MRILIVCKANFEPCKIEFILKKDRIIFALKGKILRL